MLVSVFSYIHNVFKKKENRRDFQLVKIQFFGNRLYHKCCRLSLKGAVTLAKIAVEFSGKKKRLIVYHQ